MSYSVNRITKRSDDAENNTTVASAISSEKNRRIQERFFVG